MTSDLLRAVKLSALIALLTLPAQPSAAQFWETKDWREWTKQECDKMLTDSPWSRTFTMSDVVLVPTGIRSGGSPEREVRPTIEYVAQLRSALPVRQAVARLTQLESKYDKMTTAEKQSFDKQAAEFIQQDFNNRVVVHVIYRSNVKIIQQELDDTWRASATDLPADTRLVGPRGQFMELVRYIPPGPASPEFEIIFRRESDGEPLVSKTDRRFQVQLRGLATKAPTSSTDPSRTAFHESRVLIEFDVRKMQYRGQLEY